MKRFIIGILLLAMLTMSLTGCVSKETFEKVQQDLSTAEATMASQQAQITELSNELDGANEALETERAKSTELASSLEQTGDELEETQITLADLQAVTQDTKAQLVDVQEQLRAISGTPFGLYCVMDTPIGEQLWSFDDSDEVLINGYVLVRDDEDVKFRPGSRDVTLGEWLVMAVSAPGVEVDRDILSSLVAGFGVDRKYVGVGYEEIKQIFSQHSADHYGSKMFAYIPCHFELGLGWVNDYPIRVLKHPLVEFLVNDIYGHAEPLRFEILEKTPQVMTLALDPELIVQARESAAEAGVDFEEWLTEAILAKIR